MVGILGRDPELRYLPSGDPITTLNVAESNSFKKKDAEEWTTQTRWWRVSVWGAKAEWVNENFKKGEPIFLKGQIVGDENGNPRIWTDKEGKPRASFELKANVVKSLTKKQNGESHQEEASSDDGDC